MIIWPKQLRAINELVGIEQVNTIEVLALPLRLRVTITFETGEWLMEELDHDGNPVRERGNER